MNDSGKVVFYGFFKNINYYLLETGIFTANSPGASSEIALTGANAPDTDAAVFSGFDKLVINTRGDVAFVGTLEIGIGEVTSSNYMGIWRYTSSDHTLRLVVRTGSEAPGTGGLSQFTGFLDIAISPTGDVAFLGRLTTGGSPDGLWRGTTPSDIEIVAGGTEPTPTSLGFDEFFFGVSAPVFSKAGHLIFSAWGRFVQVAIWRDSSGPVEPVEPIVKGWTYLGDGSVIPGDVAPGTGGNFVRFGGFSVNGSGMLAFFANYTGSGLSVATSLWGQDSNGAFHYIVQPGDVLETHYGPQAIYRLGFLAAPGNVSGLGSGFSDGFEVAFSALFENTSEGIFRANVGDVPPPGHVYIWSGEAGGNNWHADVDGETSWNDARGTTVYPPGNEGLAVVTIEDNVPPGGVVLDERSVAIKSLVATGGLTVAQSLTLAEDCRIESLVIDAGLAIDPMGDELLTCEGEVTLTGNSEWREGWINTNQGNVKNSGTLTIDGTIVPRDLAPAASQRRPIDPPRKLTGTFKNAANSTASQKDNVELDPGTIENEAGATWKLIKGDITVGPGGGTFINNGLLIKPEGSDTADSNFDAFLSAGDGSRIEVNAEKLILRGGAEFSGTNEIALNMSHGTTPNAAQVSELTLTRTGALERTYQVTSGKTTVSAPWYLSFEADGAVRLTHGVAPLTDGVVRLTDGVVLSVLNGTELALRHVWLAIEGGKIVAPGILTTRSGWIIWSGGTIGLPDLGPGSANLVLDLTYLTMPAGAPRTLAGTLTLSNGADALQEADLNLAGGKVVVEGECVWKIAAEVTVSATPGGKFILEPLPRRRGKLLIDVDSQVTFSAPLDNRGEVHVRKGTLQLTGPIEQVSGSTLAGGAWRAGEFENPGTSVLSMVNHSIATIGEDATVTILRGGSFPQLQLRKNYGYFVLGKGGTYETPEGLANYGRMDLSDDITTRLIVNGATFLNNGRLYIARNATVQVGYEFDSQPGSTSVIEGTLDGRLVSLNGGMFLGSGTVNGESMENIRGKLGPGQSPGFMTINADYLQADTASLEIELAGEVPGTGHDQLVIHGNATLAGTLIILPVGGFLPQVGQTYEFLTADGGSITGEFDNVVGPGEYDITYGVGGVTATVLVRPGDSDGDEDVDLLEHRDFVSCMSGPVGTVDVGCTTFDFNANGTVDLQDWCVFQSVFTGPAP